MINTISSQWLNLPAHREGDNEGKGFRNQPLPNKAHKEEMAKWPGIMWGGGTGRCRSGTGKTTEKTKKQTSKLF